MIGKASHRKDTDDDGDNIQFFLHQPLSSMLGRMTLINDVDAD